MELPLNLATVQVANNGNALALAVGPFSCASGTSTVVAELVGAPYTSKTTHFTILSPCATAPSSRMDGLLRANGPRSVAAP